jgi:hypothetical protein
MIVAVVKQRLHVAHRGRGKSVGLSYVVSRTKPTLELSRRQPYFSSMALVITHTGQTGVERGADRAARTLGFAVEGFCTFEGRDEIGPLPADLLADLLRCPRRGARSAVRATLEQSNVVVIVVPRVSQANINAGVEALRRLARAADVPHWLVDPFTDLDEVTARLRRMELATDPLRVMVTGPRLTRWQGGERLGWQVVGQLALAPAIVSKRHRTLVDDDPDMSEARIQLAG